MIDENKHHRYCFECDKWLIKEEVNEVGWGPQPGGGDGKTYNCAYCHKDLGDQIQIFNCPNHSDLILKVWGIMDGKNQEKIFYETCPQEQQKEQEPSFWEKIPLPAKIGGGVIAFLLGLLATAKLWLGKASQHIDQAEDKLKLVQKSISKNKKVAAESKEKSKEIKPKNNQIK